MKRIKTTACLTLIAFAFAPALLAQDNVAAASAFEQVLGRRATAPEHLLGLAS